MPDADGGSGNVQGEPPSETATISLSGRGVGEVTDPAEQPDHSAGESPAAAPRGDGSPNAPAPPRGRGRPPEPFCHSLELTSDVQRHFIASMRDIIAENTAT